MHHGRDAKFDEWIYGRPIVICGSGAAALEGGALGSKCSHGSPMKGSERHIQDQLSVSGKPYRDMLSELHIL